MSESTATPEPEKKPPKKPGKKAEKLVVAQRVEEVLRLRLDGFQFHEILQYAADSERNWGLNERQIRTYIQRADQLLVERMERKRKPLIARHIAQRESLYAKCLQAGDYRTALAVLTDLAELRELYPDPKLKELAALLKQLRKEVDEFKARRGAGGACPPIPGLVNPTPVPEYYYDPPPSEEPPESRSDGGGMGGG